MNSPLEQYLATLHRYLRLVPSRWRDEQIAEVRQHLTSHADELVLEGMTPAAAEEEAVRCFGKVSQTALSLMIAWWRQLLPLDKSTCHATLLTLVGYMLLGAVLLVVETPLAHLLLRAEATTKTYLDFGFTFALFPLVSSTFDLLATFLLGSSVGVLSGRRAIVGAFWGGAVGRLFFHLYAVIDSAIRMQDPKFRHMIEELTARAAKQDPSVHVTTQYDLVLNFLPYLAVLCLGAYLGRRRQQHQRAIV